MIQDSEELWQECKFMHDSLKITLLLSADTVDGQSIQELK